MSDSLNLYLFRTLIRDIIREYIRDCNAKKIMLCNMDWVLIR